MLTTGFDVPDTDCAVIARPTKSQNLYKQMVGRILRKSKDKEEAVLLDCGNVIQNLGMPLDPIKEVGTYNTRTTDHKCERCDSLNVKLIRENKKTIYWICTDCGYKKDVKNSIFKCQQCFEVHSYDSNYTFENDVFILNCTCGYKTIISKYSNEKLVEIIDEKTYNKEKSNSNIEYLNEITLIEATSKEFKKEVISSISDIEKAWLEPKVKKKNTTKKNSAISNTLSQYVSLSLLDDEIKQVCLNEYETIYTAIENNNYSTFVSSVKKLDNGNFTVKEVFKMYKQWLEDNKREHQNGSKSDFQEDYKILLLKRYDDTNQYKILEKLIKFGYFNLSEIMVIAYYNNLYKLTQYCLKKYKIETFTFPILDDMFTIDFFDLYNIKEKYFNDFSSQIHSIDIGDILHSDYIMLFLCGSYTDIEYNKFLSNLIDLFMYFNSFFSKLDIKVLFYGKEVQLYYWTYEESYNYLAKHNINSFTDWLSFKESSKNIFYIPKYPNKAYTGEWKGWYSWLNIDKNNITQEDIKTLVIAYTDRNSLFMDSEIYQILDRIGYFNKNDKIELESNNYLTFNKARKYISSLNLKSKKEWNQYKASKDIPSNIPKNPHITYKNKGWVSIDDWLGKESSNSITNHIYFELSNFLKQSKSKLFIKLKTKHSIESKNIENNILRSYKRIENQIVDKHYNNNEIDEIKKSISNLESFYSEKLKFTL